MSKILSTIFTCTLLFTVATYNVVIAIMSMHSNSLKLLLYAQYCHLYTFIEKGIPTC